MPTRPPAGREATQAPPGPPPVIRLRLIPATEAGRHLDTLSRLAHSAFTHHPWRATPADTDRTLSRLTQDAQHPGFTLVLADTQGGPAGFAYGRPACHLATLADRPPENGPLPFELRELAVAPQARGHGIGAALHDTLTAATPTGPRWLITHPHATPALTLYRTRGWQTIRLLRLPNANGRVRVLMYRYR